MKTIKWFFKCYMRNSKSIRALKQLIIIILLSLFCLFLVSKTIDEINNEC